MKVFIIEDSGYEYSSPVAMVQVPEHYDENLMLSLRTQFEELVGYKPSDMYANSNRTRENIKAQRVQAVHKMLELGLVSLDEEDTDILRNQPEYINQVFSITMFLLAFTNWLVANHGCQHVEYNTIGYFNAE